MVEAKRAEIFYGAHPEDKKIDEVTEWTVYGGDRNNTEPIIYRYAAKHLDRSKSGKIALLLENTAGPIGFSDQMQAFIEKGMVPTMAYSAAALVVGGSDSNASNFAFRTRIYYEGIDNFRKGELLIANRLNARFPGRIEVHLEEHARNDYESYDIRKQSDLNKDILFSIMDGEVEEGVERFRVLTLVDANWQGRREADVLTQMENILSRPDIIVIAGHFGALHSMGISKGLQQRGIVTHSTFLMKNTSTSTHMDPESRAIRQIKDTDDRIAELYWHYTAIEYAFFEYARDLVPAAVDDHTAWVYAVAVGQSCMEPFGNAMILRSFMDDLKRNGKATFFKRLSQVLRRDDIELNLRLKD